MLTSALLVTTILMGQTGTGRPAESRLAAIERRGALTCGVEPAVPGFVEIDASGRYAGLDVDICRALAAAIFGDPGRVRFVRIAHVTELKDTPDIDVVARRLTWELRREGSLGLLFGPVTFYDGQGFLVRTTLGVSRPAGLSGVPICVAAGPVFELNLHAYLKEQRLTLATVGLESPHAYDDIAAALASGKCQAYSGDLSDLGAIRRRLPKGEFAILNELISKEPLAPLVRDDDAAFFNVLRWTIAALIRAEELGISSANVGEMNASENLEVRRLLGVVPGNGKALGLREEWAADVIRTVGNYGEIFDRHVGRGSSIGLDRGLNRLWTEGGLMYAPPLR